MEHKYMLVAVVDRYQYETVVCPGPFTLDEAYTARSKFNAHKSRRIEVRYYVKEVK